MKTCSNPNCKEINPQPITAFSKEKGRKDGLQFRCKACHKEYKAANREKILKQKAIHRKMNKEAIALDQAIRYRKDKESRRTYSSVHGKAYKSEHKEEIAFKKFQWRKSKPGKYAGYCAKRRATKLQATPNWLTKEHFKQIEEFYILAKELQWLSEEPLQVDHIVPLQGKNASGFHVPWNLQILPKSMNASKNNKLIP